MLYLAKDHREQQIAIPLIGDSRISGRCELALFDEFDGAEVVVRVESATFTAHYGKVAVMLPETIRRGEYVYVLRVGGVVVAQGLMYIGRNEYDRPIMPEDSPSVKMYSEAVSIVAYDDVPTFKMPEERIEVVQHQQRVSHMEYDVEFQKYVDVFPEHVFLMQGNGFMDDAYIMANVEWIAN